MAEAHEVIDIRTDEDYKYDGEYYSDSEECPEPDYRPASSSDSTYNNTLSVSEDYPEPDYSPASPSDCIYHNSLPMNPMKKFRMILYWMTLLAIISRKKMRSRCSYQKMRRVRQSLNNSLEVAQSASFKIRIVVQCSFVDIFFAWLVLKY